MTQFKVLFLCTGNSCRSQMAEGFTRKLHGDIIEPFSAGIIAGGVDPLAVEVMKEVGTDISKQHSKTIDEIKDIAFDIIITLCDDARESCPLFSHPAKKVHLGFDDPPFLAQNSTTKEEALSHYRRVRDEIKNLAENLPGLVQMCLHGSCGSCSCGREKTAKEGE